jgi:hypothetical protein
MEITVRITKNYGQEAIYPACQTSETFTSLTGRKTLSRTDVEHIKSLGYTVNVEQVTL